MHFSMPMEVKTSEWLCKTSSQICNNYQLIPPGQIWKSCHVNIIVPSDVNKNFFMT